MYDVPEQLIVEADGPVRVITMNNPDMRNAFIDPLHEAMRNIWYQISRDRDARAVVLTGAGSAFCAGGNVPGFIRDYDDPEHRRQSLRDAHAALARNRPLASATGYERPLSERGKAPPTYNL